jgi:carboxylesterase type B
VVAGLVEQKIHIRPGLTAVGELLAKLGLTPQKPLQCAYQRDPETIEQWQREWTAPPFMAVVPRAMTQVETRTVITDGVVVGNEFGKIDVLIGVTTEDVHAHYFVSPLMQNPKADTVIAAFGAEVMHARYRARRPGGTALDLLADLATEQTYPRPAMRFAAAIAKRSGNAHVYLMNRVPSTSRFKACHCIDLPFVFGTFDAWREAPVLAGGDAARIADLSAAMRRAWIVRARRNAGTSYAAALAALRTHKEVDDAPRRPGSVRSPRVPTLACGLFTSGVPTGMHSARRCNRG